jgi:hypothetical protein
VHSISFSTAWIRFPYARATAALLLLAGFAGSEAYTQVPKPADHDNKAVYLIDFGKFIRSSVQQQPRSSFDICILGRDSIGQSLDALASRETVGKLPVRVRHPDVSEARSCDIVFISYLEAENIREDLAILGNADVLTVSDASDFLQRGGMIQFVVVGDRVRFAVNLDACNRAHLVLSSELLRVASFVRGKPTAGALP